MSSTKRRRGRRLGVRARSGFERRVLDKGALWHAYETETLLYSVERRYTPDITLAPGDYVEIKGRFTGADRTKTLAVLRANPGIRIRFLFQRDNMVGGSENNRYSDWCERHGIEFSVGEEIPKEWLKEDK